MWNRTAALSTHYCYQLHTTRFSSASPGTGAGRGGGGPGGGVVRQLGRWQCGLSL